MIQQCATMLSPSYTVGDSELSSETPVMQIHKHLYCQPQVVWPMTNYNSLYIYKWGQPGEDQREDVLNSSFTHLSLIDADCS